VNRRVGAGLNQAQKEKNKPEIPKWVITEKRDSGRPKMTKEETTRVGKNIGKVAPIPAVTTNRTPGKRKTGLGTR